jgi:hypothetical protein
MGLFTLTLLCCEGLRVNRAIPMRSAVRRERCRVRSDQSYADLSAAGIVTSRGRYRSWRGKAKALESRSRALSGKTVEASKTLAYLSRYTHRVAISNSRLLASDGASVSSGNVTFGPAV